MKKYYRLADYIVAVSDGVAIDIRTELNVDTSKVVRIYNPIVQPSHVHNDIHKASEGTRSIIAAGRLETEKDFGTLVKAFALVNRRQPCRLTILGTGSKLNEIKDIAEEYGVLGHLNMPGFVKNPEEWFRRADLFVLSSVFEGFGNVLVEAMACGTPVVSTDCPSGPAEILENGKWGRLVPVGDAHALANAILATLSEDENPDVRRRACDFTVDRSVDAYLRLIAGGQLGAGS